MDLLYLGSGQTNNMDSQCRLILVGCLGGLLLVGAPMPKNHGQIFSFGFILGMALSGFSHYVELASDTGLQVMIRLHIQF